MILGCIADDFTGATDLANTLVKEGMRVIQMIGVPEAGVIADDADAVVTHTIKLLMDWAATLHPESVTSLLFSLEPSRPCMGRLALAQHDGSPAQT